MADDDHLSIVVFETGAVYVGATGGVARINVLSYANGKSVDLALTISDLAKLAARCFAIAARASQEEGNEHECAKFESQSGGG